MLGFKLGRILYFCMTLKVTFRKATDHVVGLPFHLEVLFLMFFFVFPALRDYP